ncbi:hypothetical protein MMPV_005230 [Pyropia vietnamensis]
MSREQAPAGAGGSSLSTLQSLEEVDDFHRWLSAIDSQPLATMNATTTVNAPRFSDDASSGCLISMPSHPALLYQPPDVAATATAAPANTDSAIAARASMTRRASDRSGHSRASRSSRSGGSGDSDGLGEGVSNGEDPLDELPPSAGAAAIISAVRAHPQMLAATAGGATPVEIRMLARELVVALRSGRAPDQLGAQPVGVSPGRRAYTFSDDEKRALRVILNRSAAERSRNRKRARVECLEESLSQKDEVIRSLQGQVARLSGIITQLQHALGCGRGGPSGGRGSF